MKRSILGAALLALTVAGCGAEPTAPVTVTVTAPAPESPSPSPAVSLPVAYTSAEEVGKDLAAGGMTACHQYAPYSGPLSDALQTGLCGRGIWIYVYLNEDAVNDRLVESRAKGVTLYFAVGPTWVISTAEAADAKQAAEILGGIYSEQVV